MNGQCNPSSDSFEEVVMWLEFYTWRHHEGPTAPSPPSRAFSVSVGAKERLERSIARPSS